MNRLKGSKDKKGAWIHSRNRYRDQMVGVRWKMRGGSSTGKVSKSLPMQVVPLVKSVKSKTMTFPSGTMAIPSGTMAIPSGTMAITSGTMAITSGTMAFSSGSHGLLKWIHGLLKWIHGLPKWIHGLPKWNHGHPKWNQSQGNSGETIVSARFARHFQTYGHCSDARSGRRGR